MRAVKYIIIGLGALFLLYQSVYFRPLDEVKQETEARTFNPANYAREFWENKLIPNLDQAIELNTLIPMLGSDPTLAYSNYSNALGIGNIRFFLVSGKATVLEVKEDHVILDLGQNIQINLLTDYIFGNAIRDASGQIDINEFTNTMDFNNVSAEINRIVVNSILPDFIKSVREGDLVEFHGAIELNQSHPMPEFIEIIPVQLSIQKSEAR